MTNKEAAAIVERIRYYMEGGECWAPTEFEAMDRAIEALTAQPDDDDTISRQAAIDTEGLDEEIRCEMCRNPMHTNRGCDGNCKYDKRLYERIIQILDERIKPLPSAQPYLQQTYNQLATDTIYRQTAIDALMKILDRPNHAEFLYTDEICKTLNDLPSAQPEPYLDSIVSEIEKTISETRENGKHHDINVRTNGAMICFGLQLALEIIEEKRNERPDRQTGGD